MNKWTAISVLTLMVSAGAYISHVATLPQSRGDNAAEEPVPATLPPSRSHKNEGARAEDKEHTNLKNLLTAAPPVFRDADTITKQRLEPWVSGFLDRRTLRNKVEEFQIVTFDDDLLVEIQDGRKRRFQFGLGEKFSYTITVESVSSYDGGWLMNAFLPDRPDMSSARIFVNDDGTRMGNVFVRGVGRFYVRPTPEGASHIVWLSTGTYVID